MLQVRVKKAKNISIKNEKVFQNKKKIFKIIIK